MTNVYKNGVLTGKTNAGKFVSIPPAPTGDAFDDLQQECCKAVGVYPGLKGRTYFAPTIDKSTGQITRHDWKLGEEVTRWIKEGDLRNPQQVNDALSEFVHHWDRFVR